MKKSTLLVLSIAALLLTGCADNPSFTAAITHPKVGFWHGLWHGMIIIPAWIISWFTDDVGIYAIYNNGGWYNFGFLVGLGAFSSGTTETTKRSRK